MTVKIRRLFLALLAIAGMGAMSACSTIAEPDKVGLYYDMGNSDGYKFDKCINPGSTGDAEWNNEVKFLPTSLRTWNIAQSGGDSSEPTVVSTKPEAGQPSGVQVKVWSTTTFYLNTFCDGNGGVVKPFWENIGRRYGADTDAGWDSMLKQTLVPSLEKAAQDIIRSYGADDLVGNINGIRADAQTQISAVFTAELKRLTGGDYFCGPSFKRNLPECPQIEITIKDVDYADEGIQAARNEKQKQVELAAARVAEAQGQLDAAAKLNSLYSNKSWVQLEIQKLQLQQAQACANTGKCILIMGGNPNINLNTGP